MRAACWPRSLVSSSEPAALALKRGLPRFKNRQPIAQACERQHYRDGGAFGRYDSKLPRFAPQAVVKIEERTEGAGVDEAHGAEIDNNSGRCLTGSARQLNTKLAGASDV
jgi:hypothetical protein